MKQHHVGFDIGSSAVHYAVLDSSGKVIYSPEPINHLGKPKEALRTAWKDVIERFGKENIMNTSFTGSGAEHLRTTEPRATYEFDSVTIPTGAQVIAPEAESVYHIGAKDAHYFHTKEIQGKRVIREVRSSSKCGGGSGTLVEKQCRRLLEGMVTDPEKIFSEAYEMASEADSPSSFKARCGVVMQSDLIHKQNEGATKQNNLAGLFQAVAENYARDVMGNEKLSGNHSIATGGVMANQIILGRLGKILNVEITRPKNYQNIAAIGAAKKGIDSGNQYILEPEQFEQVSKDINQRNFAPRLSLEMVNEISEDLPERIAPGTKVVIGIDGGSTTTKGAIVDLKTGTLLDKLYVSTHGDPVGSLKQVIKYLSRNSQNIDVKGIATTGSARQLYQRIMVDQAKAKAIRKQGKEVIDQVPDEITCHALGIRHHNPGVQVIYEIGGQDMKYTEFNPDGTVREARMNFSCQAGGGQTLENMAKIIGLDVKSSLQEEALKAKRVPMIDATCGVFMEMEVNRLIAEGYPQEEIAAAIVFGTAMSYYHKFVGGGSKAKGKTSSAQGGPALGKAFLAALAEVSGDQINAYPHREMFGAWGAALDVRNRIHQLDTQGKLYESAFRGWGVTDVDFKKERTTCKAKYNSKNCRVRDCTLEEYQIGDDTIITGGFCPNGNTEVGKKPRTNYVDLFHRILEEHFQKQGLTFEGLSPNEKNTIGVRRCTSTIGEKGIWSGALLHHLGLTPVLTPRSNHETATRGIDNSSSEFCIARKIATGHAIAIKENPNIKYSFNPSMIHHIQPGLPPLKYCIYTEGEGFQIQDDASLNPSRTISPIIEFGSQDSLADSIQKEFKKVGLRLTRRKVLEAINYADHAEAEFRQAIFAKGDDFLKKVRGQIAYVGIGRDYVLLDPEASSNSGEMLSRIRGLDYIPQTFLMGKFNDTPLEGIVNEFWYESTGILKAQISVAKTPGLYPIRMTNFGCGPDSMKLPQERRIQEKVQKPLLELSTDGHTSNAQFVTRTEAHERVIERNFQNGKS